MELDSSFEDDLRDAVLDNAENALTTKGEEAVEQAKEALRDFASEYNIEPVIESIEGPVVERDGDTITVRWKSTHPASGWWEFGTPDHYNIAATDGVLSFVWEDPPQWVREEFEREGDGWRVFFASVDSGEGLPETRFMRWSLRWMRWQLDGGR